MCYGLFRPCAIKILYWTFRVVCYRNVCFHESTGDCTVPTMIVEQPEIGLVDCAANELWCESVAGKHVMEPVGFFVQPATITCFDIPTSTAWSSLAGIDDNAFISSACNKTDPKPTLVREVAIPESEAVVRSRWIAEQIRVRDWHGSHCSRTKPSCILVAP